MNKNLIVIKYFIYTLAFFGTNLLMAGGIQEEGVSMMKTIQKAIIAIIAVACGIMLTFEGVQGYSGRKTWAEVGAACLWILFIGGAVAIAAWIFTKGQRITF